MPKIFAITSVQTRLSLDADGRGTATFTITNTSNRSLRARAIPVALQAAQRAWLSIEGEPERNFEAEGTQQFTVRIAVPPGTTPADFSMRLDCAATDNPDEYFAESPVVAFEIPTPKPVKPFPWWLVIAAAVLLLVIGGAIWFLTRGDSPSTVDPGRPGVAIERQQAPRLVSPPPETVFNHYPRTTTLVWEPVGQAASYSVEVEYYDTDWRPLISEQGLVQTSFEFSFVGAQPGRWRVGVVNRQGNPGPKSEWREFRYTQ